MDTFLFLTVGIHGTITAAATSATALAFFEAFLVTCFKTFFISLTATVLSVVTSIIITAAATTKITEEHILSSFLSGCTVSYVMVQTSVPGNTHMQRQEKGKKKICEGIDIRKSLC